ncbi:MAG: PHP domain-containing protein, partial [Lachnospiraceae bacterium]|nr:PHP domain-containing protein [Lachnospiraceae bacterium]
MIDLHTHTSYSDGTWSVKELLIEAKKAKLELLSITDHDNVKAYLELRNHDYNEYYNGKIINGVELNVIANGSNIELLVYDFD